MYDFQNPDAALMTWTLFYQAWQASYKLEERRITKVGLTPEQVDVLWLSKEYTIPLTPAEIARSTFRESQTVAGLVSRMEREGLVRRVPKRKGHPFTEVKITAEGEKAFTRGIEAGLSTVADIMSSLSPEELEQLQGLLRKIRQKALKELGVKLLPPPATLGEDIAR